MMMLDRTNGNPTNDSRPAYSSLRSQVRIPLHAAVPLSGPLSVFVEPTNICNFRCKFCPESFADFEEKSGGLFKLCPEDFERVAQEIEQIGTVRTLNFYMMGEPFANRSLLSYVRRIKQRSSVDKVIVTSNGSLLKPELYPEICRSGLDYLRISIYGAFEETHRDRTGSPIKLQRIKNQVAGLKEYRETHGGRGPVIYVKMIQTDDPAENQVFIDDFSSLADEVSLEPAMNWNDPVEGNLSQMSNAALEATPYFSHRKAVCPFPFYTLVIHSDLRVSVCCVDWNKKTVVGDLRKNSLAEIWNGSALHHIQRMHLERRRDELVGCKSCTFLHTAPDNLDGLSAQEYDQRLRASYPALQDSW